MCGPAKLVTLFFALSVMACAAQRANLPAEREEARPKVADAEPLEAESSLAATEPVVDAGPQDELAEEFEDDTDDDFDAFDEDFEDEEEELVVFDPIEPVNRGVFWINDKLYFYVFKPIVRVYRYVPEPARVSVANFFYNLGMPVRFANKFLQVKLDEAAGELGRFVVNSTLGIGGLFDPADKWEPLRKKDEDFGQTLGHYDLGPGFYLVLPVLGPSNLRDGVGTVTDWFIDPLRYFLDRDVRLGMTAVDQGTALSLDKDTYESIVQDSLDPYLFIRNAFMQKRQAEIAE